MVKLERKKGWERTYLLNGEPLEEGNYEVESPQGKKFEAFLEVSTYEQKVPSHGFSVQVSDIRMTVEGPNNKNFSRILDRADIDTLKFKIKESV